MKKILAITGMLAVAAFANGQGYIITQGTSANITTNTASFYDQVGGTSGKTATAASGFYYALLFSQAAINGAATPTNSSWTLATINGGGALAINNYTLLAGGITGSGTSAGVQVNMAAGTAYNVQLVGWSASLGTTFAQVLSQLQSGVWVANGFFNYTPVATMTPFATAGAGDPSIFPATFANGSFSLYSVSATPVPEPGTLVLAGLGGLSLLAFRRQK